MIPTRCPHCDFLLGSSTDLITDEVQWSCSQFDKNVHSHNENIVGFHDSSIFNNKMIVIKSEKSSPYLIIQSFIQIMEFENIGLEFNLNKEIYRSEVFVEYEDRWKFVDRILQIKAFL